jgi:hypothetical protein
MTKPSEEFVKWFEELDFKNTYFEIEKAWFSYIKGLYDRPVVVPEIIVQKERFAAYRCPDCLQGAIGRGFNYCDGCGAKLDWSKVK